MGTALVMFYAPWCGHCKRLKPEFEKAASGLLANDPPVTLSKVDCTEGGKATCGRFDVKGYPTLKIFRHGELSSDYNGPREAAGITKFMRSQVGPASKEVKTEAEAEALLAKPEVVIFGFGAADSTIMKTFAKTADKLREEFMFAHTSAEAVMTKLGQMEGVVLYRPKHLANKFEEATVTYSGSADDKGALASWIAGNKHGICGHRTTDNAKEFKEPLVVAYYALDYVKNVKGTNYWRNRVLKVGKEYSGFNLAVSDKSDFQQELSEFGLEHVAGDKPVVTARQGGLKYKMTEEFSMETLKAMKDENLEIVKMDATANDVPPQFDVRGFPTIFWLPKDSKNPTSYNGGREKDDFIKYIAEHATEELKGFDRKGKAKKTEL